MRVVSTHTHLRARARLVMQTAAKLDKKLLMLETMGGLQGDPSTDAMLREEEAGISADQEDPLSRCVRVGVMRGLVCARKKLQSRWGDRKHRHRIILQTGTTETNSQ